jgi:hypothetical protein
VTTKTIDYPDAALFDTVDELERKVRSHDPDSSWNAAARITATELRGLKADIYRILAKHGPLTDDALFARYQAEGGTRTAQRVRSARSEMTNEYRGQLPTLRKGQEDGVSAHGGDAQTWEVIL